MGMKIADNTAESVREYYRKQLGNHFEKEEVDAFFYRSIHALHGIERKDLILRKGIAFSESELLQFIAIVKRLKNQEPLQHILGFTEFFGLRLKVTNEVLIPRPETEELVQWVLENRSGTKTHRILDLCTGSGCIALALKNENPSSEIYACDVSKNALNIASENGKELNLPIHWIETDLLKNKAKDLPNDLDLMVSNPPYVLNSERSMMKPNVLNYEPHIALFVEDNDPLKFHKAIGEYGLELLNNGGKIYFEINERFGDQLKQLLKDLGYQSVEVREDLSGKNRFVMGIKDDQ